MAIWMCWALGERCAGRLNFPESWSVLTTMSGRMRGRLFAITDPERRLPVTESVALPPDARDCIMSKRKTTEQKWHEQSEATKDEATKLPSVSGGGPLSQHKGAWVSRASR